MGLILCHARTSRAGSYGISTCQTNSAQRDKRSTHHPLGARTMSAWSMKTRRAPSRHCMDAKAYGHTTTVMHDDNGYTPPPSPTSHNMSPHPHPSFADYPKPARISHVLAPTYVLVCSLYPQGMLTLSSFTCLTIGGLRTMIFDKKRCTA